MKLAFQQAAIGYSIPFIQPLQMEVESPMLIGLVGSNGVGKSTLLRTLCGLTPLLSGNIVLEEEVLSQMETSRLSEFITFLPNSKSFYQNLTVQELLVLSNRKASLFRVEAGSLTNYELELLEVFGLQHLLQRKLASLSDGQYQLVSIVFALARKTKLVLLDEPLAFLDINNRKQFMDRVVELVHRENRLVVFSSHDLAALTKCTQLWQIENNKLNIIEAVSIPAFCNQLMV